MLQGDFEEIEIIPSAPTKTGGRLDIVPFASEITSVPRKAACGEFL